MKLSELISIIPPPTTTTPNAFITVDRQAARKACTINNNGAINKNVYSIGSVTPQTTDVRVIGIKRLKSCSRFSGFAVL
jgi:hypothetical protein